MTHSTKILLHFSFFLSEILKLPIRKRSSISPQTFHFLSLRDNQESQNAKGTKKNREWLFVVTRNTCNYGSLSSNWKNNETRYFCLCCFTLCRIFLHLFSSDFCMISIVLEVKLTSSVWTPLLGNGLVTWGKSCWGLQVN